MSSAMCADKNNARYSVLISNQRVLRKPKSNQGNFSVTFRRYSWLWSYSPQKVECSQFYYVLKEEKNSLEKYSSHIKNGSLQRESFAMYLQHTHSK